MLLRKTDCIANQGELEISSVFRHDHLIIIIIINHHHSSPSSPPSNIK